MKISLKKTQDYGLFKLLEGNRSINLANLNRIKSSMEQSALVSPIIVNEKMEIIDGQHRFLACKELGLPVHYVTVKGYGLEEVHTLNTNGSNWGKKEYLDSYCKLGNKEYLKLQKFTELFPELNLQVCIHLLSDFDTSKSGKNTGTHRSKVFESGGFKVQNWYFAVQSAKRLLQISQYYDGFTRRSFVAAIVPMFKSKKFDFDSFISKLHYKSAELVHCPNKTQYVDLIEDIYNYRSRKKISLRYL